MSKERVKSWHYTVALLKFQGESLERIAILKNCSVEEVWESIYLRPEFEFEKRNGTVGFGHRDEPYQTEAQMLSDEMPKYNYIDLSESEKEIYHNLPFAESFNKEIKKQIYENETIGHLRDDKYSGLESIERPI